MFAMSKVDMGLIYECTVKSYTSTRLKTGKPIGKNMQSIWVGISKRTKLYCLTRMWSNTQTP